MNTKHRHFLSFHIAGFSYWDGCIAFNELKIGTELTLAREEDNKFDPYAVAIYYGDYKLGFIPRSDNHEISKFIELGYSGLFEVRINQLSRELPPEQQVGVIVYIIPAKAE
ncbi:MAG: HIRAN domain-containing protein [Bacteroidota bacterium]|nr:HIRAN domain-containing protein [Bacteroidota bacterium]